jgi:dCMP deaminase
MLARFTEIAGHSDDPDRKVACFVLNQNGDEVATGTNKLPRGCINTTERVTRPLKYLWIEHAERNAIFDAAKRGASLQNCTLFTNYWPCADCMRAIIQSGITKVVSLDGPNFEHQRWGQQFRISMDMLEEAGLNHTILNEN